ncbi:MAG: sulfatase-like hydrolase/transferase [Rubripirellula sp.]
MRTFKPATMQIPIQFFSQRFRTFTALIIVLANGLLAELVYAAAGATKPNVILMMADDLGYADLACYGSEVINTPVLDKMASEGLRLTNYYAGCTVCTPSRMALMTGAYPARVGWRGGVGGYKIKPQNGLAPEALTIAEVFQSTGYKTAICGKWHLGEEQSLLPMNQGFKDAFYITKSNNQTKKLYRGSELVMNPFDNRRLTEQFTSEAIKFIKANRASPFFLYIPFTAPHFPAQAHPEWKGRSSQAAYGDVVEELDSRVGEIIAAVKECNLDQDTIVVFTSDNGPEPGQKKWARATPYRGLKWSALEGGNRVPCIVRAPGRVPAGHTSDQLTAAIDLLPTLAQACGIELAAITTGHPMIDGVNVWDTFSAKPNHQHARKDLLIWHGWGVPQAIRVGDWKLYLDVEKELPESEKGPVLINLIDDPAEKNNLSDEHPQKVEAMKRLAFERIREIETNGIPLGGPADSDPSDTKRGRWLN